MASDVERHAPERKRGSGSAVEGGSSVPSVSRDKRSGLVVPDGYSPPPHSSSSRRHGTRADGHGRQGESWCGFAAPRGACVCLSALPRVLGPKGAPWRHAARTPPLLCFYCDKRGACSYRIVRSEGSVVK